ncbi:uridine kinase [Spiroplasma endosymbiont of Labia minor]|uniref:uridine kinase n=1 Tax=Spiroplasma endosymbiont of Labia minor TaxID=3066305 RepID=UPI0030D26C86
MKQTYLILIAGGTASGKTTVAEKIAKDLLQNKSVCYLAMDNYYKEFKNLSDDERKKINYDHPNSYDLTLLENHLNILKNGGEIEMPIYDYTNNCRTDKTIKIAKSEVYILDGILALHVETIRNLADLKLFIKTPDDIRFIRRFERDFTERHRSQTSIIEQYLNTVRPMHIHFVEPSIDFADIIIPYLNGNDIAIDLIATKVKSWIK